MKTLDQLGKLRTGFQMRGAAKHEEGGQHAIVQLGDVREEGIDVDALVRMDLDRVRPKDFVARGDVLLRSRGASYGAAVVPECPCGTVAVSSLYVVRPDVREILPEYLAWFINLPAVQARLAGQAGGTYIPTVSRNAFAALEIIVPPMADQRRVAEIDALVREERRLALQILEKREQFVHSMLGETLERYGDPGGNR